METGGLCIIIILFIIPKTWKENPIHITPRDKILKKELIINLRYAEGNQTFESFKNLCDLIFKNGRRALIRHKTDCSCVGADESCFAQLILRAANNYSEDAMKKPPPRVVSPKRNHFAPFTTRKCITKGPKIGQFQTGSLFGHSAAYTTRRCNTKRFQK